MKGSLSAQESYETLSRHWLDRRGNSHFNYFRCRECSSLNIRAYPEDATLVRLYACMPPNMDAALTTSQQRSNQRGYAQRIASLAARLTRGPLRILELGSDCGWLLTELASAMPGRIDEILAVEPNVQVQYQLINHLRATGCPAAMFSNLDQALVSNFHDLDLVIAIHVLDHLFHLDDVIACLRARLSAQGLIVFVVHHPGSLLARLMGRHWPPYCPQHPQLLTPQGVGKLAARHGMRVVASARTWNHFSLSMALEHLHWPSALIGSIPVRAPLGNRFYALQVESQ